MQGTCGYCLGDGCVVCQERDTRINEFGEAEFIAPILNDSDEVTIVSLEELKEEGFDINEIGGGIDEDITESE